MRYAEPLYRPPSEARSLILQATLGCSWNRCAFCGMYRDRSFRVRPLDELLAEVEEAGRLLGPRVRRVFVADGDALVLPLEHWLPLLGALRRAFPRLERVSCYASARNLLAKTPDELRRLREAGLALLYIGPESGDGPTLERLAKGATPEEHAEAARRAREAGLLLSATFLLGAGGRERSREHALASARLAGEMDPAYLALLSLLPVPGTPLARWLARGRFELPSERERLLELRLFVAHARPTDALFRSNHASNALPLGGRLPRDRDRLLALVDAALEGRLPLRPDWARGL